MKKARSIQEEINSLCEEMKNDLNRWENIRIHGGYDPNWPDGVNMNLIRNHIFSYKRQIFELCKENGLKLPDDYYCCGIPPEVDQGYLCPNGECFQIRKERLKHDNKLVFNIPPGIQKEMCLF